MQDLENILSYLLYAYPLVPIKLRKIIKHEAKNVNVYLEALNAEWGQIDPTDNRRVK